MNSAMKALIVCVLTGCVSAAGAAPAPMDILSRAMTLHRGVKDYIAQVAITTDIPDVDIPNRTATVYVKPPDKTHVESRGGFVLIPKRALLFGDLLRDIEQEAEVTLAGTRTEADGPIYCVKVIPKEEGPPGAAPRVLTWINGSRWTMERVQVWEGKTMVMEARFTYRQTQGFWMPTQVVCTIPGTTVGGTKPGHVTVTFSDYRINTGLTDAFFEEKAQQSRGARRSGRGPRSR